MTSRPSNQPMDIAGQRFGRLTALSLAASKPRRWLCQCECGEQRVVRQKNLRAGNTASCGCQRRETCSTHGHNGKYHKSPTWGSWAAMLSRCRNPNATGYAIYGGRGISVCSRWLEFANFLSDMGDRPDGMTLDRIDSDGNYEPGNCRWATPVQQQLNTRKARPIIVGGAKVSFIEASRRLGVSRGVIRKRIAEHGDPARPHLTERRAVHHA